MALTDRSIQRMIEERLNTKLGWAIAIIGPQEIARAVESRRIDCQLPSLSAYWNHLQAAPGEWEELTERLVVPETWFFRDSNPFALLRQYSVEWLKLERQHLRVLSVPCSSGEEPYSIVMALLDAGLPPQRFHIDAVDISDRSLQKARRAVYRRNSFRGNDLTFRDRYFTPTAEGYELCDRVRRTVHFFQGNLLDACFLATKPAYDVIFCRNVLIYLDTAARIRVLQRLEQLLQPQGLLFVGGVEATQVPQVGFVPIQFPGAFAYRKQAIGVSNRGRLPTFQVATSGEATPHSTPSGRTQHREQPLLARGRVNLPKPASRPGDAVEQEWHLGDAGERLPDAAGPAVGGTTEPLSLQTARQLADQGRLQEAITLCQKYLLENPLHTESYVLLGQVQQARGREDEAELCFQRAVFLEPQHTDALMHLALLKDQRGDRQAAERLRKRIQRSL